MAENPTSACIGCGAHDDHPKDLVILPGDQVVRWHIDCHALAEPPCPSCTEQLKGLKKGSIGADMRAHLTRSWKD